MNTNRSLIAVVTLLGLAACPMSNATPTTQILEALSAETPALDQSVAVPSPANSDGPKPVVSKSDSAKERRKNEPMDARTLLEKGRASGALPEGMVIRIGACLGASDVKAPEDDAPDELKETWEFTSTQVHRVAPDYKKDKSIYERIESRPFDSKDLCKALIEGKAIEVRARKGEGPEVGFVGTNYSLGTRFIEVIWKEETVLNLLESNTATMYLYRESDARSFGALYKLLEGRARAAFTSTADAGRKPSDAVEIVWGDAVNGLQMGVSPHAETKGAPLALFDGKTLQVEVHLRNAGKSPVSFIPNTFGCAALGPGGAIPVTKLILTPNKGGEPISISYQGHNHVSDQRPLDAGDLEYYATVLAPGKAVDYPYTVRYTPGQDRDTSWQRTGGSNLVPEGKYKVQAVVVVDRKESQWKGEITSGSLEVEIHPSDK